MRQPNENVVKVFQKEHDIKSRAGQILEREDLPPKELLDEYRLLYSQYQNLLSLAEKVTNFGDRNQRKLIRLKDELARRNQRILKQKEELQALNRQLEEASLTDTLTGLRNRRFLFQYFQETSYQLMRRFQEAPNNARGLLFMMIDIDHFKVVNDTYGHAAGDMVLAAFAQRLRNNFRAGDLIIRMGGEEFLIVVMDAFLDRGQKLAEKLRQTMTSEPFELNEGRQIPCTCSIGFTCFPFRISQPARFSWEQAIRLADLGLYAAKKSGRNTWIGLNPLESITQINSHGDFMEDIEGSYRQGHVAAVTSLSQGRNIVWM